jgi:hypothetical protein
LQDARGKDVDLSQYKGKTLLIVNVASQWYAIAFVSLFSFFNLQVSFCHIQGLFTKHWMIISGLFDNALWVCFLAKKKKKLLTKSQNTLNHCHSMSHKNIFSIESKKQPLKFFIKRTQYPDLNKISPHMNYVRQLPHITNVFVEMVFICSLRSIQ